MKLKSLLWSAAVLAPACIVHHHHYNDEGPTSAQSGSVSSGVVETEDGGSAGHRGKIEGESWHRTEAPQAERPSSGREADPNDQPSSSSEPRPASGGRSDSTGPNGGSGEHEEPRWDRPTASAPARPAADRAAAPSAALHPRPPKGFLPGCRVETHPSGWILATCQDMQVILITGPAAQRSDNILSAITTDEVARQVAGGLNAGVGVSTSAEGSVTLAGNTYEAHRITVAPREGPGLSLFAPDKEVAAYRGAGLFTVASSDVGKTALACHQEGRLDERRCLEIFESVLRRGLADVAPSPNAIVTVAGVEMDFREACHYNTPTGLVCQLNGSLRWFKGSSAEARRRLQGILEHHQDDHGIPNYHNPHDSFACNIGGRRAECHEIAIQGVLDSPTNVLYAAVVDTPDGSYQFSCHVRISDSMNEPCRLLLEGAHSGRWH